MVACEAITVAAVASITIHGSSAAGHQVIERMVDRLAQLQQQRALAEVVEHQRRPHQREPGDAHRLAAEVPHVGVQRLAAGERQEHRADDRERHLRAVHQQADAGAAGSSAASTCGWRTIGSAPMTAITTNHTTMIGPNRLPTRAVP